MLTLHILLLLLLLLLIIQGSARGPFAFNIAVADLRPISLK